MMQQKHKNGQRHGLVTIVVPAKDEEDAIGETLSSLPIDTLGTMGLDVEVVLLDGNSKDATCEIAQRHGARVIPDAEPGKGAAFRHARRLFKGDYIVMLDADGTYPADAIPRLLAPILRDEAEVVMGTRVARPHAMSPMHKVGNAALSTAASVLYGRPCPDVCTGMWAFRKETLQALPLQATGFELEAELFALSSRLGERITHIWIDYLPRKGESKLSTLHGLSIGWCLVRTRFMSLSGGRSPLPRTAEARVTADDAAPTAEVRM